MDIQIICKININNFEFDEIQNQLNDVSFIYKITDESIIINRRSNGASKFLKSNVISSYKVIRNTDPDIVVLTTTQLDIETCC